MTEFVVIYMCVNIPSIKNGQYATMIIYYFSII